MSTSQISRSLADGEALLRQVFPAVWKEIVAASETVDGIVFVFHNPKKLARACMKKLGIKTGRKKTTVAVMTCEHATQAFGHDLVSRRFLSKKPKDDEIKIFLTAGDGSALFTVTVDENGKVWFDPEPEVALVRTAPQRGK